MGQSVRFSHVIAVSFIPVLEIKLTSDPDLLRTWIEDNLDLYKASLSGLTLAFDLTHLYSQSFADYFGLSSSSSFLDLARRSRYIRENANTFS